MIPACGPQTRFYVYLIDIDYRPESACRIRNVIFKKYHDRMLEKYYKLKVNY